jgi:hypothetical protein
MAWHSSGAHARDPGLTATFLWAQLAAATTRLRRKSWCLRFERAHDHPTRFHRASAALQGLRGIAGVSAGRPLFIPFLRIALGTPETARSCVHRVFRAMARPGLEPGTPRFSVVHPRRSSSACLQRLSMIRAAGCVSRFSRTLRRFSGGYGRRGGSSAFSQRRSGPARRIVRAALPHSAPTWSAGQGEGP